MSEPPDIRVYGETRYYEDRDVWDCSAYGGGHAPGDSVEVRVEGATEEEAQDNFRVAWNERLGTTWTDDEFGFTRNWGRADGSE